MTRVLVAYGSKNGGTAEIAEWIGTTLRSCGLDADVRSAQKTGDIGSYDAMIIGGALYAGRWHRRARRFVRRHERDLLKRPVWLFSSGPLDHTAGKSALPSVRMVVTLAERTAAAGTTTFGGVLRPDVRGFPASAMAKKLAGDYRDRERVEEWTRGIAAELERT